MERKTPHPVVLEAITKDYTYDPLTGIIYRNNKSIIKTLKKNGRVREILIAVNIPGHISMWCHCSAWHVAWYLTYNVWPSQEIDHIDCDPTNNRIENLRLATRAENNRNKGKGKRITSSQYKGVSWSKADNKWAVKISKDGKSTYVGSYSDELEAAKAYDQMAIELHGSFARININ